MFDRGKPIVIIKSSATGKAHPNVGDKGYINNLYFYPLERFFLLDGFFFSYNKDKEPCRCEKKRFIIDVGMDEELKKKLRITGLPRSFFERLRGYGIDKNLYSCYCLTSPMLSLWNRHVKVTNTAKMRRLDPLTKIPYGQIRLLSLPQQSLTENFYVFNAWLHSLTPILYDIQFAQHAQHNRPYSSPITNEISKLQYGLPGMRLISGGPEASYLIWNDKVLKSSNIKDIIVCFRKIITFYLFVSLNERESLLKKKYDGDDANVTAIKHLFYSLWQMGGLFKVMEDLPQIKEFSGIGGLNFGAYNRISTILSSIFLSDNCYDSMVSLAAAGYTPNWSLSELKTWSQRVEKIKKEATINSAALNRIYERDEKMHRARIFSF